MRFASLAPVHRRAWYLRLLCCVLLALGGVALGAAQQAAADTSSDVQSASSFALPSGGTEWTSQQVTCPSAGLCVSVGAFQQGSQNYPLVVSFNDGQLGAATQVALPADADPSSQNAYLDGISCQSAALCVAYGSYNTTAGAAPMVVTIVNGVPSQAAAITLPINEVRNAALNAVSCPSLGDCVVVGSYDTSDAEVPLVVDVAGGVPQPAVEGTLPADADTPDAQAVLSDVACQGTGSCVAVGSYDSGGEQLPYVMPLAGGVPQTATSFALPSNAYTSPYAGLEFVACPQTGACEAVGSYAYNSSLDFQTLVVPINAGSPGTASEIPQPATSTGVGMNINGLSCSSASLCVAGGDYHEGASNVQPVLIAITGSGATAQESTTLPGNQSTGNQAATIVAVSCLASGPCLAGGLYETVGNDFAGMLESVSASGQIATVPVTTPVPADIASSPQSALNSLACASSGGCVGAGLYNSQSAIHLPYVVSVAPPLTLPSSSLAGAKQGTAYAATLPAPSGAWGIFGSWSISAGSLPAGISLNAQTGVISGTPTGSGTSSFTVQVTAIGAPAQTASEQLSIAVAATTTTSTTTTTTPPVPPSLRLLAASGKVSGNKLAVKLACSGAACSGTVKLEVTKVVTVKKGKKRVRKHETVVLGSARYSVAAGTTKTVSVTLGGAGKRALASARRHRLKVTELATLAGGRGASRSVTIFTVAKKKG